MSAKLIFPQEIEVWYVLPLIRKKIALKMVEEGLQQKKVAEIMGITPAAVCQYKSSKRAKKDFFDDDMNKELKTSIKKIIKDHKALAKEIIKLSEMAKGKGIICKLYKDKCALNDLSKDCPYCYKSKEEKQK